MIPTNQFRNHDHLFEQVCHNRATEEEMEQAENLLQTMEQRLEKQIDQWETVEQLTQRRSISSTMKWVAGVAASLLFILMVSIVNKHYKEQEYAQLQMTEDTFDNPEDAAAEAQRALLKFSEAINKAIE